MSTRLWVLVLAFGFGWVSLEPRDRGVPEKREGREERMRKEGEGGCSWSCKREIYVLLI